MVAAPKPRVIFVIGVRRDGVAVVERVELKPNQMAAAYLDERSAVENKKGAEGLTVWVSIEVTDTEEERIKKAFMAGATHRAWVKGEWSDEDK